MSQRHRKKATVAFKVDIRKAFDTVSWTYLGACVMRLGFNPTACDRIVMSVTSVSTE